MKFIAILVLTGFFSAAYAQCNSGRCGGGTVVICSPCGGQSCPNKVKKCKRRRVVSDMDDETESTRYIPARERWEACVDRVWPVRKTSCRRCRRRYSGYSTRSRECE